MENPNKTPNYLNFIVVIFALIILLISLLAIFGHSSKQLSSPTSITPNPVKIEPGVVSTIQEQTLYAPKVDIDSPVLGDPKAPISIFEYSSFSCPNSRAIQPTIQSILKLYPGKVKLIWKDMPLTSEYPKALIAHIGARCAQKQNKFWDYENLLWQNQNNFSTSTIINLAQKLKLDIDIFNACLINPEMQATIINDEKEADALAIPGTPHFYINKQEISGVGSVDDFKRLIEAELNRK